MDSLRLHRLFSDGITAYTILRHSRAFRDLESDICDCESIAKIAAQFVIEADDGTNRELVFAVAHASEMLTALKANYYAAWHGEKPQGAP